MARNGRRNFIKNSLAASAAVGVTGLSARAAGPRAGRNTRQVWIASVTFWPSAFAAGKKINTKAWENQYCVVSSTRKDTSKICDITGEEIAASGIWNPSGVCAPVNLEKAFLHSWPYSRSFPDIIRKYGRKVRCYSLHEEEFSIIESLSADLKVANILREFNLKTYREHLQMAEDEQLALRV